MLSKPRKKLQQIKTEQVKRGETEKEAAGLKAAVSQITLPGSGKKAPADSETEGKTLRDRHREYENRSCNTGSGHFLRVWEETQRLQGWKQQHCAR